MREYSLESSEEHMLPLIVESPHRDSESANRLAL